jgi:hypothetical protein
MRSITLRPEAHRRLLFGHPWIYSNEIVMDAGTKALPPAASYACSAPMAMPWRSPSSIRIR